MVAKIPSLSQPAINFNNGTACFHVTTATKSGPYSSVGVSKLNDLSNSKNPALGGEKAKNVCVRACVFVCVCVCEAYLMDVAAW